MVTKPKFLMKNRGARGRIFHPDKETELER